MFPFGIEVVYQLREYLAIVQDFAGYGRAKQRRDQLVHPLPKRQKKPSVLSKALIAAIATPIFFYKMSRVADCKFNFTESGLTRESKSGVLQVAWADVQYVYSLSPSFLIVKAGGGMPIPYRCLSDDQRDFLANFFASLNASRHVA